MTNYDKNALKIGCLAHWSTSAFAQFGSFATTMGRLAHWSPSAFVQFFFSATTIGRLTNWPTNTFAKFSLLSQIRANRLNLWFGLLVALCRSFRMICKSTMLWKNMLLLEILCLVICKSAVNTKSARESDSGHGVIPCNNRTFRNCSNHLW